MEAITTNIPQDLFFDIVKYISEGQYLNWDLAIAKNPFIALKIAVNNNNIDVVNKCIFLGFHIKQYSHLLSVASMKGYTECVKLLIPVSNCNFRNNEALHYAADNNNAECVKLLLENMDVTSLNSYPLRISAEKGYINCLRNLIPYYNMRNNSSVLKLAAENGFTDCVELLIPHCDPTFRESEAMRFSAVYGKLECLKLLLPHSYVNACDSHALRYASRNGFSDCVKLLIENGANVTASKTNALLLAIKFRRNECIKLLLPHCTNKENNNLMLKFVCLYGYEEYIEPLVPICEPSFVKQLEKKINVSFELFSSLT